VRAIYKLKSKERQMLNASKGSTLLAGLLLFSAGISAQDKQAAATQPPITPLSVQVTLSEYQGGNRISTLPYVLHVSAPRWGGATGKLRVGARIPIAISTSEGETKWQYTDAGTNIDCQADIMEGGRYKLNLTIERSSIVMPGPADKGADWVPGGERPGEHPILRQFRDEIVIVLRDGETMSSDVATDPLSGRTVKLEVTLHVSK
jgi:hypothetical protein